MIPQPPAPASSPVYGPAPHRYGEPPPPTYTQPGTHAGPTNRPLAPGASHPPGAGVGPARPSDYARWGRRVPAYLIDFAPGLLGAVALAVAYVLFLIGLLQMPVGQQATLPNIGPVVVWAIVGGVLTAVGLGWDVYNRWLVGGRTGRSLGKRVMKLRLIGEQTGEPIGPLDAVARDLVHILDAMACVGFLWPLWDDRRQTFADMQLHTVVIDERLAGFTAG